MEHPFLLIFSVILVIVPYVTFLMKYRILTKGDKLKRQAIKKGYVADAVLTNYEDLTLRDYQEDNQNDRTSGMRINYRASYDYQVDGRPYRYTTVLPGKPAEKTRVFFPTGDPQNVFVENFEPVGAIPTVMALLPLLLVWIVYKALGGILG